MNFKVIVNAALSAVALTALSACAPAPAYTPYAYVPDGTLARFNQTSAFLADQLTSNRAIKNLSDTRIAVASFVAQPTLQQTDRLGIAIQDRLMHEMYSRGFQVVDYKVGGDLKVRPTGDFVYSRLASDLRSQFNIHYFLTGIIESTTDGYVIHARIIDASNSLLVSSAQAFVSGKDAARIVREYGEGPTVFVDTSVPPRVGENKVRLN